MESAGKCHVVERENSPAESTLLAKQREASSFHFVYVNAFTALECFREDLIAKPNTIQRLYML